MSQNNAFKSEQYYEQTFFILKEGQMVGPFNPKELSHKLKEGKVLLTDSVSIDHGKTWQKLHEIEFLENKELIKAEGQLPPPPTEQVFERSQQEASSNVHKIDPKSKETEAIIGLAYIGQLKPGKAEKTVQDVEKSSTATIQEGHVKNESITWPYKLMLLFSIIGLSYVYMNWPSEPAVVNKSRQPATVKTKVKVEDKKITQKKVVKTKTKITPKKAPKRAPRRSVASQTSFAKSKSFKKAKPKVNPKPAPIQEQREPEQEDDFYYDNGDEPVEQDPVRSQISKETLDPEVEDQEYREEDYDAEREEDDRIPTSVQQEEEQFEEEFLDEEIPQDEFQEQPSDDFADYQ